jgi:hypothetical protein
MAGATYKVDSGVCAPVRHLRRAWQPTAPRPSSWPRLPPSSAGADQPSVAALDAEAVA